MIPRAIKRPEANSRAYIPRCVSRRTNQGRDDRDGDGNGDRDGDRSLAALRDRFHPVVWNGTIAFLKETTAVMMDPESVRNHPRAEVRTLFWIGSAAKPTTPVSSDGSAAPELSLVVREALRHGPCVIH